MKIERNIRRIELGSPIRVWTQLIQPKLSLPSNVEEVCKYGFIKALCNTIRNSTSEAVLIKSYQNDIDIQFELAAQSCDSEFNTILVKERNYYWSQQHNIEWFFFASKMFDEFSIESSGLVVTFIDDDVFITTSPSKVGTSVKMKIKNGFYPDFADTSKKPDNGQKECLCQREENTVPSSNMVLLNKPGSPVLAVLRLLKNWALPQIC